MSIDIKKEKDTDCDESLHGIELLAVAGGVEEVADVPDVWCIEETCRAEVPSAFLEGLLDAHSQPRSILAQRVQVH